MNLTIRPVTADEEMQAVLRLRRQIYGDELGYRLLLEPDGSLPPEPLDANGTVFGAFEGARLVGAVRVNYGDAARADGGFGFYASFYGMHRFGREHPEGISIVTRLMALPAWRNGRTMAQFGVALYEHTRDHRPQVRYCLIDCVPPLKSLFEAIGYRQTGPALQHPVAGTVLPMGFAVYHRHHFERVGSPLAAVCPRHDAESAEWFDATFAVEPAPLV